MAPSTVEPPRSIRADALVRRNTGGPLMVVLSTTSTLARCAWRDNLTSRAGVFRLDELELVGAQEQAAPDPVRSARHGSPTHEGESGAGQAW